MKAVEVRYNGINVIIFFLCQKIDYKILKDAEASLLGSPKYAKWKKTLLGSLWSLPEPFKKLQSGHELLKLMLFMH
jgi:hypothetical protein